MVDYSVAAMVASRHVKKVEMSAGCVVLCCVVLCCVVLCCVVWCCVVWQQMRSRVQRTRVMKEGGNRMVQLVARELISLHLSYRYL